MNDNGRNNRILIVIVVLTIIFTLFGGTLAYLSWQTAENQQTLVSVKVQGGSLKIVGNVLETGDTEINSTALRPTNDCDGVAALVGEATVTAVNGTASPMVAILKLDAALTRTYGSSYDLTINGKTVDARSYLKWAIVETTDASAADNACDSATYNGTFEGITSSTGIETGIKFSVASATTITKKYKMYIWLDETYEFTNTGNEITNPMDNLKVVAKWSTESILTNEPQPEAPVLDEGMIPVTISSSGTVKTVSENDASWYDYSDKEWANVVLVDDDARSTYKNTSGVTVSEDDILAYYVWIPRYSYRIPKVKCSTIANVNETNYPECYMYVVSDEDKESLIDMWYAVLSEEDSGFTKAQATAEIENGLQTGTFSSTVDGGISIPMSTLIAVYNDDFDPDIEYTKELAPNNTTSAVTSIDITFETTEATMLAGDAVTSYRTHPAFWWDDDSDGTVDSGETIAGIWVGKFETSANTDSTCYTTEKTYKSVADCVATNVSPRVVPNVQPLAVQSISTQFTTSQKFTEDSNIYGLSSTSTNAHMMKNSEWGAVAYLSHSVYGINEEMYINNSTGGYTGRSGGVVGGSESLSTNSYGSYTWIGQSVGNDGVIGSFASDITLGTKASTTGNATGVYGMSGGTMQYVMGVLADDSGNPRSGGRTDANSGFNGLLSDGTSYTSGIDFPALKYYDLYTGTSGDDSCNGGKCYGHALSETAGWYDDYAVFVSSDTPWLFRSGWILLTSYAGVWMFTSHYGCASTPLDLDYSWRSVIIVGYGV